ncbi:hypothetical protein BOQ63_015170 [Streptomyces viridifaciens]|nr:hypothetical protein BOQ63_015170 [Streptomyces viridifaciens]
MSKTLRHTTLATTINLYGRLFKDSATRPSRHSPEPSIKPRQANSDPSPW